MKFTFPPTEIAFDPTIMPIRSCLSNFGLVFRKKVPFEEKVDFIEDALSEIESTVPAVSAPKTRRIKHNNNNQNILAPVKLGHIYLETYSIWDIPRGTLIAMNNSRRKELMTIEYEEAEVYQRSCLLSQYFHQQNGCGSVTGSGIGTEI